MTVFEVPSVMLAMLLPCLVPGELIVPGSLVQSGLLSVVALGSNPSAAIRSQWKPHMAK